MDMREASAMTEASGLVDDPAERQFSAAAIGRQDGALRLAEQLRTVTLKAPLQSLLAAFLLGGASALGRGPLHGFMPRKLKTFQSSLGFYDLAIAAPSMKSALEAWGAGNNLFHQGAARETVDSEVVRRDHVEARRCAQAPRGDRTDASPSILSCPPVWMVKKLTTNEQRARLKHTVSYWTCLSCA